MVFQSCTKYKIWEHSAANSPSQEVFQAYAEVVVNYYHYPRCLPNFTSPVTSLLFVSKDNKYMQNFNYIYLELTCYKLLLKWVTTICSEFQLPVLYAECLLIFCYVTT